MYTSQFPTRNKNIIYYTHILIKTVIWEKKKWNIINHVTDHVRKLPGIDLVADGEWQSPVASKGAARHHQGGSWGSQHQLVAYTLIQSNLLGWPQKCWKHERVLKNEWKEPGENTGKSWSPKWSKNSPQSIRVCRANRQVWAPVYPWTRQQEGTVNRKPSSGWSDGQLLAWCLAVAPLAQT